MYQSDTMSKKHLDSTETRTVDEDAPIERLTTIDMEQDCAALRLAQHEVSPAFFLEAVAIGNLLLRVRGAELRHLTWFVYMCFSGSRQCHCHRSLAGSELV